MATISFLHMNNLGIQHLDAGEYEKAADSFRKAFNTLKGYLQNKFEPFSIEMNDMSTEATAATATSSMQRSEQPRRRRRRTRRRSTNTQTSRTTTSDTTKETVATPKRKNPGCESDMAVATVEEKSTPRKRQKLGGATAGSKTETDRCAVSSSCSITEAIGPLGRPLRLGPPRRHSWGTMNVYATSVLYNFAYALHRAGIHANSTALVDAERRERLKKHAANVYDMAIRLSIKGRSPVVLWLCCHNLQHLLLTKDGCCCKGDRQASVATTPGKKSFDKKYRELEEHKAKVLRFMAARSNPQQIYLIVLAMLGISDSENPDSPAAAA